MACNKKNVCSQNEDPQDTFKSVLPKHEFFLSNDLDETSGLIFYNGYLFSHNDSRGNAAIYRFDTINGEINQTITITNATNNDWEALAIDDNFIYIGEFGNNGGNRKDLKIYKLAKDQIPENGDVSVQADIINFNFSDQSDFSNAFRETDFDCEAFISKGEYLYLFSKNWSTQKTKVYKLSKAAGTHEAQKIDEFDVGCMITGADIYEDGSLVLIGYIKDEWVPVFWLFYDYSGERFFSGKHKKLLMPEIVSSQTEGISFVKKNRVFISGEKTRISKQRVFSLNFEKLKAD